METIKVFKPGTTVETANKIHATVIQVQVTGVALSISYQIVWWKPDGRIEQWVDSHEVKSLEYTEYMEIGFHKC